MSGLRRKVFCCAVVFQVLGCSDTDGGDDTALSGVPTSSAIATTVTSTSAPGASALASSAAPQTMPTSPNTPPVAVSSSPASSMIPPQMSASAAASMVVPSDCPETAPVDGSECAGMTSCDYDTLTCRCSGMGGMGGGTAASRAWRCTEDGENPFGMPSASSMPTPEPTAGPSAGPSVTPSAEPSASASSSAAPSASAMEMPAEDATWAAAWSVMTQTCLGAGCHAHAADDTTRAVGGFGVDTNDEEYSRTEAERIAGQIDREVQGGAMPPRNSGVTLTAEQKQAIADWADSL
jgi:hypothetical protein